jgi:APA family basic amino acid/polyamine antiporter
VADAATPIPEQTLRRSLSLTGTTLTGVGIILGAGIYVLIGEAALDAGGALWAAFLLAAVLAASTGLSYAELASMFPEAGGSASFAREAFGRRAGFVTGWLLLTMVVLASAAVAIGFGGYLADLTRADGTLSAVALIALSGVVVWAGVRETVGLAVLFTLIEASGLAVAIAVGLPFFDPDALLDAPKGVGGVLGASSLVFFAFTGFEQIANLSEETRQPARTIPRAIVLAVSITTVIYLLVAVASISVLPWEELSASDAPLADVVRTAASDRLGDALSIVALFATANTVLLLLATGARLSWGMARRGLLPPPFLWIDARRQTPWFAAAMVAGTALAFSLSGDIGRVAQLTNVTLFVAFIVVNAAVVRLRIVRPDAARPFRLRGSVRGAPVSALVGGASAAILLARVDPPVLLAGCGALLLGVAVSIPALSHEVSGTSAAP